MFLTPVCVARIDGIVATDITRDFVMPFDGRLTAASLTDSTAHSASDSNYQTITCVNKGAAGAGSTAMIATTNTKSTGTGALGDLSANIPKAITLSTTYANTLIKAGEVVQIAIVKASSGTLTNGSVEILAVPGGY